MKNKEYFRQYAKDRKVRLWQIADALGISEPTMTRMLRHEISKEQLDRLCGIVDRIASGEAVQE